MRREFSLEDVMQLHGGALRRLAASFEARSDLREELLQEIVLAIWRALPRLKDPRKLQGFVLRIAHNQAVNHVIRQSREPRPASDIESDTAGGIERRHPEAVAQSNDRQQALVRALRQLPLHLRQVMTLLLEDLSYAEIGAVLDISVSNVGVRVNRAKTQLREILNHD